MNRNSYIFNPENAFESTVCEMSAILSRPQCVKHWDRSIVLKKNSQCNQFTEAICAPTVMAMCSIRVVDKTECWLVINGTIRYKHYWYLKKIPELCFHPMSFIMPCAKYRLFWSYVSVDRHAGSQDKNLNFGMKYNTITLSQCPKINFSINVWLTTRSTYLCIWIWGYILPFNKMNKNVHVLWTYWRNMLIYFH